MSKQLTKGNDAIVSGAFSPAAAPSTATRSRRPAKSPKPRRSTCPRRAGSSCRRKAKWPPSICCTAAPPPAYAP